MGYTSRDSQAVGGNLVVRLVREIRARVLSAGPNPELLVTSFRGNIEGEQRPETETGKA